MTVRKLLFAQFTLLAITALLYFLGFFLYLHWVFWWYDILLHLLGGAWVVLVSMWLLKVSNKVQPWASIIAVVIMIGALWEVFEMLIGAPRESNYLFDTSLDLLMDVIGAVGAIIFVRRKERAANSLENGVIS